MLEVMSGADLRPIDKTLIHSSDWSFTQSQFFQLNGFYEPNIVGPHGQKQTLRSLSTGGQGWTGGWNAFYVSVDNTKLHRLSCWIKITQKPSNPTIHAHGYIYLGTNTFEVHLLSNVADDVANGNPYFHVTALNDLPVNEWLLLVGYVHGVNAPNQSARTDGGIYRFSDKAQIVSITTDYKFRPEATALQHRCYHYYDQIPGIEVLYNDPRIDVCDGSEPTIAQLMNGYGINMRKRPIVL